MSSLISGQFVLPLSSLPMTCLAPVRTSRQITTSRLFDRYPQNETVYLKDKTPVKLPLHLKGFSFAQVIGTAKSDYWQKKLEEKGVEPLALGGKVFVSLTTIAHRDTSIGPYHEFIVGVLLKGGAFYTAHLYVDSDLSQRAGSEIWGFPKELLEPGQIQLQPTDQKKSGKGFSIRDDHAHLEVQHEPRSLSWPSFLPKHQKFITPEGVSVSMISEYDGLLSMNRFQQGRDAFVLEGDAEWIRDLKQSGYSPFLMMWNKKEGRAVSF